MAKARIQRGDTTMDIEISDVALVVSVLGLAAGVATVAYLVTRDKDVLDGVARIAEAHNARLVHHGVPLLK